MAPAHAISVLLEADLLAFNRAIGVARRRNLPIASVAVGPSQVPGMSRLTFIMQGDEANADRLVKQLQKTFGVREAVMFPADGAVVREVALIKLRASRADRAALQRAVAECGATLVDEGPEVCVVEILGSTARTDACIKALERFGIHEIARSGAIALRNAQVSIPTSAPTNS